MREDVLNQLATGRHRHTWLPYKYSNGYKISVLLKVYCHECRKVEDVVRGDMQCQI